MNWTTSIICPILIGRDPHLEALERLIEQTAANETTVHVALVSGEAGIGKSRLVAEAKTHALERGFAILQGNCFEQDHALPYAPLRDLLLNYCIGLSPETMLNAIGELAALIPELAEQPSSPAPDQDQRRLFNALLRFLIRQAHAQPLLIVIEDLHWCDEVSLDALLYLARHVSSQPILFVFNYRNDEVHAALQHFLAGLDRARVAVDLPLTRFNITDVEAMIRAIFEQRHPVRREFVETIHALTDGNPFFIEEILKSLVAGGDIFASPKGWTRKPIDELQIPRTVQDAVQRRTQSLSDGAKNLLSLAAIAGRRFGFALLEELTAMSNQELLSHIKELIEAQIIVEESAELVAFRHELTRQAAYTSLLLRERKVLHRKVGEAMERVYADAIDARVAELAHHFYEAGAWDKTYAYSLRAGERAQTLYAPRAAVEHFTRAIQAAQQLSQPTPISVLRARGRAYEVLGDFDGARDDFTRALNEAQAAHDRHAEWQGLIDLGFLWVAHDLPQSGDYFHRALDVAHDMDDPTVVAHTLNRLGNWRMMVEQPLQAREHHEQALAIFRELNDQRGLAETLDLLGTTSISAADLLRGIAYYERATTLFRELGDRHGLASSLTMLSLCNGQYLGNTSYAGDVSRIELSLRASEEALKIVSDMGWRSGEALVRIVTGLVHSAAGDYEHALIEMQVGLDIALEIEHQQWQINAYIALGALHLDLFALPEARNHLEKGLALAQEIDSLYWIRTVGGFLASTYIQQGEPEHAARKLDAMLLAGTAGVTMGERHALFAKVELLLAQGDAEQALKIIDGLLRSTPGSDARAGHGIPRLAQLHAEALIMLERADEAQAILLSGCEFAQRQATPALEWRIHALLGWVYQEQDQQEDSERESDAARTIIERLAATIADAKLRDQFVQYALSKLPQAAQLSTRAATKKAFGGLTAREHEVATLIAQGKSNRAIAEALVLSERTVEKHVENVMSKLGFGSRAQVAAWVVEKSLAGDDSSLRSE